MGEGEVSPSLQPGASATLSSGLQTPARNVWLTPPARPQNPLKKSRFRRKNHSFLSYLFNEIEFLLLFSKRNLQISNNREQGERSRRHAVFAVCFCLLCRLLSRSLTVWSRATALSGRGSFAFIGYRLCRASFG